MSLSDPKRKKLALVVVTTHPIQYIAPWYASLSKNDSIDLHVVFARTPTPQQQGIGFGTSFVWDTPLRQGYSSSVLDVAAGIGGVASGLRRLRIELRTRTVDAVLITGWNEPLLAMAALLVRLMGLPLLMRGESNDLRPRSAMVRLVHRQFMRLPGAFLKIGQANQRFYRRCGVSASRIFEGAYFVDSDRMQSMADVKSIESTALRHLHGFREDDLVFAFCGKHVPFKQPDLLVEAAAIARARQLPVKLLLAGSGPLTQALRERADALKVPVRFTGFLNQSELWQAYVPADVFVLPSNFQETWGLVTNEAMLFGLPVLVSDQVGCCEDLVRDDITGYRFSPNPRSLADAMERCFINRARLRDMGQAGRKLVRESYSFEVATRGLLSALLYICPRQ